MLSAIIVTLALLAVGLVQWLSFRLNRPLRPLSGTISLVAGNMFEQANGFTATSTQLAEGASEQAASL